MYFNLFIYDLSKSFKKGKTIKPDQTFQQEQGWKKCLIVCVCTPQHQVFLLVPEKYSGVYFIHTIHACMQACMHMPQPTTQPRKPQKLKIKICITFTTGNISSYR